MRTVYVRTYAHTAYCYAFQYNVSNSFCNIPNCSRGHGGCSAASLGMLSQSRRQRQRLQRCRIYPQVGNKSHWNSRERVLEPEELSFLQATDSDAETREGATRAAEGAAPLTYAWVIPCSRSPHNALHLPSVPSELFSMSVEGNM